MKMIRRICFRFVLPPLFWLLLWAAVSAWFGQEWLLPSPIAVLRALLELISEGSTWLTVAATLGRVMLAYGIGVLGGFALALLCHASGAADALLAPAMRAVRATPVASFIILALVWLSPARVPVLAGVLMVLPVAFGHGAAGFASVDPKLLELARLARWPGLRTFRHVRLPAAMPQLRKACETTVGLCLKAGVAAEVIGLPKHAMGTRLHDAKVYLENDRLLAWTLLIVLLSFAVERLMQRLLRGKERA